MIVIAIINNSYIAIIIGRRQGADRGGPDQRQHIQNRGINRKNYKTQKTE